MPNQKKVALVTGGSRGIGKAICKKLAEKNIYVFIQCNKNKEAALALLNEIKSKGGDGFVISADLSQAQGIEHLCREVEKQIKIKNQKIDFLINNAGIGMIKEFEETTSSDLEQLWSLNIMAPFLITQKALNWINDGGRIVNITSIVTRMAMPSVGAYSMTKGALDTMTLFLAKKLGPRQITVNSVAPGIINTDMNASSLSSAETKKYMESLSVFNRVGEPEDIADVVAFLVSEQARWITGQRLEASGGTFLG